MVKDKQKWIEIISQFDDDQINKFVVGSKDIREIRTLF